MKHTKDGLLQMRGKILRHIAPGGAKQGTLVQTADEWVAILRDQFGLDVPDAVALWPRITARHEQIFSAKA